MTQDLKGAQAHVDRSSSPLVHLTNPMQGMRFLKLPHVKTLSRRLSFLQSSYKNEKERLGTVWKKIVESNCRQALRRSLLRMEGFEAGRKRVKDCRLTIRERWICLIPIISGGPRQGTWKETQHSKQFLLHP